MKMKNLKYILLFALASVFSACETFVKQVDEFDPTQPRDADLKLVVIGMEVEYMSTLEGENARTAGMWSGYFTGVDRQYIPINNYSVTAGNFDSPWNNVYSFVFKQSRIVQDKATALNNKLTLGMAQVVEAHIMGTSAALWGDIPYSQAINVDKFPNPAYDPQQQVIDNLIALLDAAIANIKSNVGNLAGDFLFGTQVKTLAAAYSLKARYLLYKKDYAGALTAANLGIATTANDIVAKHGTTQGQDRNIYYDFQVSQRPGYMSAKSAALPKRLDVNQPTANRNHTKTIETARFNSYFTGALGSYDINVGSTGFFAQSASFPLITAFETILIVAECEARLSGVANGLTALNAHRALLRTAYPTGTYADFIAADFAAGGIENKDNSADIDALLREIYEEKWVSLFAQQEAFNEVRRTNNAVGVPVNAGTAFPQRFLYSQAEVNANKSAPNPIPDLFTKTSIFQ
jgi:starch-binding outer membrane protein, SusD/RagB family